MAVSYFVLPIDVEMESVLRRLEREVPREPSRLPSPNEVRAALAGLDGYRVTVRANTRGGWDAEIVDAARGYDGASTSIWMADIEDPDAPHVLSLHQSSPVLAALIVERLARRCGPLVITEIRDAVSFVVVAAGADPTVIAAALG
jgi:hypothetical protein